MDKPEDEVELLCESDVLCDNDVVPVGLVKVDFCVGWSELVAALEDLSPAIIKGKDAGVNSASSENAHATV